jgi:Fur family ferric uptake transcriptional regulator
VSDELEAILDQIRNRGGRVTPVARRLLQLVLDNPSEHRSSIELVRLLSASEPTTESTIYRSLDRLVAFGVLERIQIGSGPPTYHLSSMRHEHVVCSNCGRVIDVPTDLLDEVAQRLRSSIGFILRIGQTSLSGVCEECSDHGDGAEASRTSASRSGRAVTGPESTSSSTPRSRRAR